MNQFNLTPDEARLLHGVLQKLSARDLAPRMSKAEQEALETALVHLDLALWNIYDPGMKQFLSEHGGEVKP